MKAFLLNLLFSFIILLQVQSQNHSTALHLTDNRDGKTYNVVKIGKQTWMAKNLSYDIQGGSWPLEMSEENRKKAGLLYSWKAAQDACPTGWHLPSKEEWHQLINFVGKNKISEGALVDSKHGGSNSTGFSALHGGCIDMEGFFADAFASFWTSSESGQEVWYLNLDYDRISLHNKDCKEWAGFSIRCVKND